MPRTSARLPDRVRFTLVRRGRIPGLRTAKATLAVVAAYDVMGGTLALHSPSSGVTGAAWPGLALQAIARRPIGLVSAVADLALRTSRRQS
jgi:hypothetical protein